MRNFLLLFWFLFTLVHGQTSSLTFDPENYPLDSFHFYHVAITEKQLLLEQLKNEKISLLSLGNKTAEIGVRIPETNEQKQERETRLSIVEMRIQQLNILDTVVDKSLHAMVEIVTQNFSYEDISHAQDTMKYIRERNAKIREEMIEASFLASRDYTVSMEKETNMSQNEEDKRKNTDGNVMDDVINNLDKSVKNLEESISNEDRFKEGKKVGKLETVVKLHEESDDSNHDVEGSDMDTLNQDNVANVADEQKKADSASKPKAATTIIDAENNQYVLVRSNDPTMHFEDVKLFRDIILLVCFGYVLGAIFSFLRLPSFFGFVGAGMLLGPPGYNQLQALIQVETIGQLGVLLILFHLGLEFSFEKVRKHWRVTVVGGSLMIFMCIALTVFFGMMISLPIQLSFFLGCTISLSSTTVVLKCLEGDAEKTFARLMLGILILQDLALGLMLAVLPSLAMTDVTLTMLSKSICYVVVKSIMFIISSLILGKLALTGLSKLPRIQMNSDLQILGSLSFCFGFIWVCENLNFSVEIGCFTAGVILANGKNSIIDHQALHRIESLRDFFGCLFFAAIGIHVYPVFLLQQAPLLLLLTISLMGFKIFVAYCILHLFIRVEPVNSVVIGVGLSQISEFAFVLASRAKIAGILNKDLYYTLIGMTSISLLLTPFAWKIVRLALKRQENRYPSGGNFDSNIRGKPLPRKGNIHGWRSGPSMSKVLNFHDTFSTHSSSDPSLPKFTTKRMESNDKPIHTETKLKNLQIALIR